MQRKLLPKSFFLAVAVFLAAIGLSSCHPVEEPPIPQTGYWYDLDMPAQLEFQWQGGSCTIAPVGYIYLDGQLVLERPLAEGEVELRLVEGNEDFLERDGFYFATSNTSVNHRAYYKAVWTEYGATAHLAVIQYKKR